MTVGNDTVYAWLARGGIPTLNKCLYLCPICNTLFWYILSTYRYVLRSFVHNSTCRYMQVHTSTNRYTPGTHQKTCSCTTGHDSRWWYPASGFLPHTISYVTVTSGRMISYVRCWMSCAILYIRYRIYDIVLVDIRYWIYNIVCLYDIVCQYTIS